MPTPVWRGSRLLHLQPGYPEEDQASSGSKTTLVYRGPYATLRAQRPRIGQSVAGYAGLYVERTRIKPDEAGTQGPGTLTVTLSNESTPGDTIGTTNDVTVEIDAGQLAKSIFSHPTFDGVTAEARKQVEDLIEQGLPLPNSDASATITKLYDLLLAGTDSYLIPAPTVKKTTTSATRPNVGAIGRGTRTTAKPDPAAPAGYEWLKTGDRALRQGRGGKWERIEEWTGADEWSTVLYG